MKKNKTIFIILIVFTVCVIYFKLLPFRDRFVVSTAWTFIPSLNATFESRSTNSNVSLLDLNRNLSCSEMPVNPDNFVNNWNTIISGNDSIYAAFEDENMIKIIAVTLNSKQPTFSRFCRVWLKTSEENISVFTVAAKIRIIPDHHGTKYTAAFYICPLPGESFPVAVAVSDRNETPPCKQPILPVIHAKPSTKFNTTFRVCVKPLFGKRPYALEMIEWIEFNRILGVTGFTIYVHSTSNETEQVLQYYQTKGVVETLPWAMPPRPIHSLGQLAAINDCLYRHRNRTRYLALFDMDEFIIPKQKKDYTWSDMIKRFPKAGTYSFRNTFFRKTTDKISTYVSLGKIHKNFRLMTLTHFKRDIFIYAEGKRSKLIVKPENIDTIGIHTIWEFRHKGRDDAKTFHVKPEDGLMHHYRVWNDKNNASSVDKGILKYERELMKNVKFVLNELAYSHKNDPN